MESTVLEVQYKHTELANMWDTNPIIEMFDDKYTDYRASIDYKTISLHNSKTLNFEDMINIRLDGPLYKKLQTYYNTKKMDWLIVDLTMNNEHEGFLKEIPLVTKG